LAWHKGRSYWRRIDLGVGFSWRALRAARCQNAQSLKLAFVVSAFAAYGSIANAADENMRALR